MSHEPECPCVGRNSDYVVCICDRLRQAYRRGHNDHARTVQHWQDTHGAYRVQPLPPEQNASILKALEDADVPWNQHGTGTNS